MQCVFCFVFFPASVTTVADLSSDSESYSCRVPCVHYALLPLRLFTSTDVCKQNALLCLAENRDSLSHTVPSAIRSFFPFLCPFYFFIKRSKAPGKETGVSSANGAQISAWLKQREVTERSRVPKIALTPTWPPTFFFFSFLTSINGYWSDPDLMCDL